MDILRWLFFIICGVVFIALSGSKKYYDHVASELDERSAERGNQLLKICGCVLLGLGSLMIVIEFLF